MLTPKKYPNRSPNWYARGTVAGVDIFESTGTTDKLRAEEWCKKREAELYDELALGKRRPITFAEAAVAYKKKGGEVKYLVKMLDYFLEKPLREIGQAEIDEAAAVLYPNAKASTINRSLISPFITVARSAVKAELPGAVLRPIERRKEKKPVVTPATDEHIEKLLPHCSNGLQALILLMTYTGLRTGEALKLRGSDFRDGYAFVPTTKNDEPRMVPVPDGWQYPDGGFGYETTQGVGKALQRAHIKAGLPYRDGHELGRHGFAARWLANDGTLLGLTKAGNWKSLKVAAAHYGHLEKSELHEKMRELSKKPRAKSVQS